MTTIKATNWFFHINLAVTAFVINWIWEMAQMFAYRIAAQQSWRETLFFCTFASFIDALTISVIYGLATLADKKRDWRFYLLTSFLGLLFAILFEKTAFMFGWWNYNEQMPLLPAGIGLLPLLQLTLLTPAAIFYTVRLNK